MGMRMTYNALTRNVQNVIVDRFGDLAKQQEILSSGKRLMRPSDSPVDVANDLGLRSKLFKLNQHKDNINDGLGYMQVTDTALSSLDTIMQRVRELAIQGSSDTLSSAERVYISREVEQLIRQSVSIANTKYKNDYIFAGAQTRIEPFPTHASTASSVQDYTNLKMAYYDASGGPGTAVQIRDAFDNSPITKIIPGTFELKVGSTIYQEGTDYSIDYVTGQITILPTSPNAATLAVDVSAAANYQYGQFSITFENITKGKDIYGNYVNNEGDITRTIEDGINAPINITASDFTKDPTTGTDLMDTLITLGENLIHNSTSGVNNSIAQIDTSMRTLLAAQSKNGARINRLETTLDRNDDQTTETTRRQSILEDVDIAEAATKFSLMQTVYNAALQSAGKIIQPSLANFL